MRWMVEGELRRFERPDLAWAQVTGADRLRFLHAMLTNTVLGLAVGEGNRSLLLSSKGRVVADCLLLVEEEGVQLGCDTAALEGLLSGLDHYLVADEVELEPVDRETQHLVGEGARRHLETLLGQAPPTTPGHHLRAGDLRIVSRPVGSTPGWLLVGAAGAQRDASLDLPLEEAVTLEALRIAAGEPAWSSEVGKGVFPQEVGLDACLHPTKGCYLGQETMVRIETQGQVRWSLVGLTLEGGLPAPGDRVSMAGEGEKEIGEITSIARAPEGGQPIALARLRREQATEGTAVQVAGEHHPLSAVVVSLPFPGKKTQAIRSGLG